MPRLKRNAGIKVQCWIIKVNFRVQRETFYTFQIPPYEDFLPIPEKIKISRFLIGLCMAVKILAHLSVSTY